MSGTHLCVDWLESKQINLLPAMNTTRATVSFVNLSISMNIIDGCVRYKVRIEMGYFPMFYTQLTILLRLLDTLNCCHCTFNDYNLE